MTDDDLVSRRDLAFQLYEVLDVPALLARPRFAEHDRATFEAALDAACALARERLAPHAPAADEQEPRLEDGRVVLPATLGPDIAAVYASGLPAAAADLEAGGLQLPATVAQACWAPLRAADVAASAYIGLTMANANVIERFGSSVQRRKYLEPLRQGHYFGTMALTEPQAGSSLTDLAASAVAQADGSYRLRGQKIFISGGEHELAQNIIHLVLARTPDAPPGAHGLSLFTVARRHVDDAGRCGERNDVALAGLVHKCGWRGTVTTLLNFGERDACVAELVGARHHGLACMFQMMNEARIGVGMSAAMLGYRGYRAALAYACERRQGRRPGAKDASAPQLALIEHADVRRMLLAQKAYVEGALALGLMAARLVDEQHSAPEAGQRAEAAALLDLLTPVVKSWPAQFCLEANSLAIQVHGGYGYARDYGVERLWRDNRLNMIHEGTHGIQAIDLLGRKLVQADARALERLGRDIVATIAAARACPPLRELAHVLEVAWAQLRRTLAALLGAMAQDAERGLANASAFLEAFGHVVVGWTWLRQALAAVAGLGRLGEAAGQGAAAPGAAAAEADFYRGKLQACAWFLRWELPRVHAPLARLQALDDTVLSMRPQWF